MRPHRCILFVLGLVAAAQVLAATQVALYTPYDFAPFVVDRLAQKGLIYDFQRELNRRGGSLYQFKVETVPRIPTERLRHMPGPAIVPYVAQEWFDDSDRTKFDWTRALLEDANVIVSPRSQPLDSLTEDTARRKVGIGNPGLRLDPLVENLLQKNLITLNAAASFGLSLQMVAHKRADFYVSGRILVQYLINELKLDDRLYVSPHPIRTFSRRILVSPKGYPGLQEWLDEQVLSMEKNDDWQKIMAPFQKS